MDWVAILEPVVRHKDRRSPLYLRITDRIRSSIEAGELQVDDRLPPDRELARLLKLDRSTIARAYNKLESDGYVFSHVGRGTFVADVARRTPGGSADSTFYPPSQWTTASPATGKFVWDDKFSRATRSVASIVARQVPPGPQSGDCIELSAGSPTDEFFPQSDFGEIVGDILRSSNSQDMFGYSAPEGHPELRKQVQYYLQRQGIEAGDDQILILSGSQQGIDLVARTLLDVDDVVLMEDPSYFWALCNFTASGARCLPVAVDDEGLRLDQFESIASRIGAKLLYTMPSFQNPTGTTMPQYRRKKLIELAAKYNIAILEDNFVGDLCYEQPAQPLKSQDEYGCVIYQGTFSKALCPGLRLGWLVAPQPAMERLRLAKRTCDLSTNSMAQVILAEYLRRGLYDAHLAVVLQEYKARLDAMCAAIDQYASQWISYVKPSGGMFVWGKLPPGYSARELLPFAEREGVTFGPGDVFYVSGSRSECLRLTFIQQTPQNIEEGIRRLSKALKVYGSTRRKARAEGFQPAGSTFI